MVGCMRETTPSTFRKTSSQAQISFELAGLRWLAAAEGAQVVPVLDQGPAWIDEPRLYQVSPSKQQAREFGRALAQTHAAGADWFGQPPAGFAEEGWIGSAPLPLVSDKPAWQTWGAFFSEYRIRPYLSPFRAADLEVLESFCAELERGTWDHPQPASVSAPAARTHGDLWGGNVMWTATGAVLIDPAASGGHAETDLANLGLFGAPHLGEIISGYEERSALADGWEDRVRLHQMHLLVVHADLFGGGYIRQSVDVAHRYLQMAG